MSAPRIRVSIDGLVLNGVPAERAAAVVAELRQSLQQMLGEPNAAAGLGSSRTMARLPGRLAPVEPVAGGAPGTGVGASAAVRIMDGLRR